MKALAGTGTMVRFILRRDRIVIPLYVVIFAAFVMSQALGSRELYDNQAEREVYAATAGSNPAMIALTGPAYAIDTVGGDTAWQVGGFGGAVVAMASMILVGRHTRAEEQSGRSELLRANVLGRYAHPTAALIVVAGANALLAAATALALISLDLPTAGSIAFGASMGAVGVFFAAVGVVAAQITENASTVYGIGGAVLGAAYLLRAAGDIGEGTLSWLSPIGWAQRMRPFADERWWPLLLFVGATVVLLVAGFALMARRDDGAGLVAARPGPARASSGLMRPSGFALRLRRGLFIGWTAGLFVGGLAMGSFGEEVDDLVGDSDLAENIIGQTGGAGLVDSFFATILLIMAMIGTVYAVQSALRMRSEETAGRLEPLLATATSRWRWAGAQVFVTVAGVTLVLFACGLGAGISSAITSDDPGELPRLLGAQLASLPAVLVVAGIAVALFGLVPRAASLAWAALGGCFFIGLLGPILQLPDWAMDLSPFTHVPKVPSADLETAPLIWLTAIAAALMAIGLAGFRRRDVG
jgi:ABC-2 type transport system permease protein